MDRTKFKNALNEMDSNQRIALLYLENQIIEQNKKVLTSYDLFNQTKSLLFAMQDVNKKIATDSKKSDETWENSSELINSIYDESAIITKILEKMFLNFSLISKIIGVPLLYPDEELKTLNDLHIQQDKIIKKSSEIKNYLDRQEAFYETRNNLLSVWGEMDTSEVIECLKKISEEHMKEG